MPRKPRLSPDQARAILDPPSLEGELIPVEKPKKTAKPRAKANANYELSLNTKPPITPELIEDIQKHYSGGATLKQIAYALGIDPTTLAKRIRDNPDLSRALHKARLDKVSRLAGKAFEMAMAGDRVMIIFLLKTVGRFSETWKTTDEGEDVPTTPLLTLAVTDPIEAMKSYAHLMSTT